MTKRTTSLLRLTVFLTLTLLTHTVSAQTCLNDAGIWDLPQPQNPFGPGLHPTTVSIRNYGTNVIDSVRVEWEVDGVPQPSFDYTTAIPVGGTSAPIPLINFNYTDAPHTFKIWTTLPNATTDCLNSNDTLTRVKRSNMLGQYTLGGANPDYNTIADVAVELASRGIAGPVEILFRPGVYTGSNTITPVQFGNPAWPVCFNGGHMDSVRLVHNGFSPVYATLRLNGVDYLTIKNMTIENTGNVNGLSLHLRNGSDYITVDSCRLICDSTVAGNVVPLQVANGQTQTNAFGNNANYMTVRNSIIVGGKYGVFLHGGNSATYNKGLRLMNNTIISNWIDCVRLHYLDSVTVSGNYIGYARTVGPAGIYSTYIRNFYFTENEIDVPDQGIRIFQGNQDSIPAGQSKIVNNMIYSSADDALIFSSASYVDVFHNSLMGDRGFVTSGSQDTMIDLRNNIFYGRSSFALESWGPLSDFTVDHNIYYTPPSNFLFVEIFNTAYPNLTAWQSAMPLINQNSLEGDPIFIAPPDLHLVGTLAHDMGDSTVGVPLDIDGETRPMAPTIYPDIGADEYIFPELDAEMVALVAPSGLTCGSNATPVTVTVQNDGVVNITAMDIVVNVTGDITQTFNYAWSGNLPPQATANVTVGAINTFNGADVMFGGWVDLAMDTNASNDSIDSLGLAKFMPMLPIGMPNVACGADSGWLHAQPLPFSGYHWYDSLHATTPVASGDSFFVSNAAQQSTWYLGFADQPDSLTTDYIGLSSYTNGVMFNLRALNDISIHSLDVNTRWLLGMNVPVDVYYVYNGHWSNYTGSSNGWTMLGSFNGTSAGPGNPTLIDFGGLTLDIAEGDSMAVYLNYWSRSTPQPTTYENCNLVFTHGIASSSPFAYTSWPQAFAGTFYYHVLPCNDTLVPVSLHTGYSAALGPDTLLCDGDSLLLDPGIPGAAWDWSTGATSPTLSVAMAGGYWVDVTDTFGCISRDTLQVQTLNTPTAAFFSMQAAGAGFAWNFTDLSTGNPTSWFWQFGDSGTDTVQNPAHNYQLPGAYTVVLISSNACGSDTDSVAIVVVGLEEGQLHPAMNLYPNPAGALVWLEASPMPDADVQLRLWSAQGRLVREEKFAANKGRLRRPVALRDLSAGVYIIELQCGDLRLRKRLIRLAEAP